MTSIADLVVGVVAVFITWTVGWWTLGWILGYIHSFVRDDAHIESFWFRNTTQTRGSDGDPSR